MDKIKKLIEQLNNANYDYYVTASPKLSDFEYDKLYDDLVKLEQETGIIYNNSPTQKVGYTVLSELNKVTHKQPMLSLEKTKDVSKLVSFLGDNTGLMSWKMDGLTVVLTYDNGILVEAVTRGNGHIGEDITHNASLFCNVPTSINYKNNLIIRGEAVITYADFEKINEKLEPNLQFKNPRNLCSGTVRQLNNEIVKSRQVYFYAFSLVNYEDFDFHDSKANSLKWLENNGFDVVTNVVVTNKSVEDIVKEFSQKINEATFGTDGLVITYDSYELSQSLGTTSKYPKDSMAFKWKDELAETTLLDVEWNTSRTGVITPVAIFEPVELEGTTVSRASLHNVSNIERLQLGIGDAIAVYKANMIIPQIAENFTLTNNLIIPSTCSTCGEKTNLIQINDATALYCSNANCKAKLVDAITHYVSRDALNIDGLSGSTISKFVECGFINNFTDIYNISKYENEITEMQGFGKKSYEKLILAIEKSKTTKLANFIYGLGINQVGLSNAKLLVKKLGSGINVDTLTNLTVENLIGIDGFGEVIASNIVNYFQLEQNVEMFRYLYNILDFQVEPFQNNVLNDMTFVITGNLEHFSNRNELTDLIEQNGGKVSSSVSKNTSYLINNDNESNSSKNKKAISLGVTILTELQFLDILK